VLAALFFILIVVLFALDKATPQDEPEVLRELPVLNQAMWPKLPLGSYFYDDRGG
jgi:hypothetical protein